jgi:Uncharacterized protein conserved in bacteria (DUF2188)
MKNANQLVSRSASGWGVRKSGSIRASAVFKTQEEAIERGKEIAEKQKVDLFIFGKDGRIRERTSFKNSN